MIKSRGETKMTEGWLQGKEEEEIGKEGIRRDKYPSLEGYWMDKMMRMK